MEKLTQEQISAIVEYARQARGHILKMTTLANSGHPGGSMSTIDMMMTLYHMIKVDPKNPDYHERDRVIVSNGHISPAVYSTLGLMGFFPIDDAVSHFRQAGSIYEGHVERDVPGVEWGTGNLGQGLSAAVGMALACRLHHIENHFYVFMGDGEQQKGQISEARRFAFKYGLKNITVLIDYNQLQISGNIHRVMPQKIIENYISDGWDFIEIQGHDIVQISNAILKVQHSNVPTLILAHTVMGKGIPPIENQEKYHGSALTEEQLTEALQILGIENDLPRLKEMRKSVNLICSHKEFGFIPEIKTDPIHIYEKPTDNRSAWGTAVAELASINLDSRTPIAVFDCDLQASVKTGEFEKIAPEAFFQGGIMEHNTAVMAGAMSTVGIQAFWADFGVFGIDEAYNMQRLNDINRANIKLITTHVGIDVGEDGKTHQCVDYVGLMHNLYHFKVIVPADPNQTDRAVRWAASNYGNVLIAMGRSKLDIIRKSDGSVYYDEKHVFVYGKADQIRDGRKAALFVMGTLAARAVKVIDRFASEGIDIQLWNVATPLEIDNEALQKASETGLIFTYEDHNTKTGLGAIITDRLNELGLFVQVIKFGVEDYACSGASDDVFALCGLDEDSIYKRIKTQLK
jgi:transketolase